MKSVFGALLISALTLFAASPALAQSTPVSTSIGKQVLVRIYWVYGTYNAVFDTDGESIGDLSEDTLNKKFIKIKSATSVINFMAQNDYKVTGFTSMPGSMRRGDGTEFGGYNLLFEHIK